MARFERWLVFSAALALGTVACQQLLGLGDFKDCDDTTVTCDTVPESGVPDVDIPDTSVDAAKDALADVLPPLPDGSSTSDWATFRMPHTQDGGILDGASLNEGGNTADLGQGRDPTNISVQADPMYPDASIAFDAVTNRVWLVETEQTLVSSFAAAQAKCASRKARVPSRIELISLLDPTIPGENGMIRREVGTYRVPEFWTSTVASRNAATGVLFWIVDFKKGATAPHNPTPGNSYGVLCVR
jgi:hypothetical protein